MDIVCNDLKKNELIYRPFHKTLPRSGEFVNKISVSFMKQTVAKSGINKIHIAVKLFYEAIHRL